MTPDTTPIVTPSDLGALIRRRRKVLGMSQDALAAITGIPQPNLSKIERGQVAATFDTTLRLLSSLGVELHARVRT